jgi:hypothetical protein
MIEQSCIVILSRSADNIAVCSMVDGRLQWALQPSSRERTQSPQRVHFDDSLLFSPSVISLTNMSTQSNVRTIERLRVISTSIFVIVKLNCIRSVAEPGKGSSQLRLSSRLGLLSPQFSHSDFEHDGFLDSAFLRSSEESLYDIAQVIAYLDTELNNKPDLMTHLIFE